MRWATPIGRIPINNITKSERILDISTNNIELYILKNMINLVNYSNN